MSFPPEPTEDAEKCLKGLWESLQRAGDNLDRDALLSPTEAGWEATFYFRSPLPEGAGRLFTSYVKAYLRACGWQVRLRIYPGFAVLALSRA